MLLPPPLLEICEIGLSKMQFPVFSGPELVNHEGLTRHYQILTKNEIFDWFGNYIIIIKCVNMG